LGFSFCMGIPALAANRWLLAALAMLPIASLIGCYFIGGPQDTRPTGFIQYDQAYYMAEARQHFAGGFHLLYGSPASSDYDTPRVFFHPQTLLLGALVKFTGIDPGLVYSAFGLVATLIFFRVAIALYEFVVGVRSAAQLLVLPLFLWGGGLVLLYGLAVKLMSGGGIFTFDTGGWGANLARGVVYGVEGYYHALFFTAILPLLRRWYATALVLMVVTCASHPFTGTELALVLIGWIILENFLDRSDPPPLWFSGGVGLVLLLHLGYWLVLLPQLSPEYAALSPTWQLPWGVPWNSQIAEYEIVGLAAVWQLRDRPRIRTALADRTVRLLFAWFAAAFMLANHDLFISPHQPKHFTRGYIWVPLFLIGARTMVEIVERLLSMPRHFGPPVLIGLYGLMFLDNVGWFGAAGLDLLRNGNSETFFPNPIYIGRSARDVLKRLDDQAFTGGLVVSNVLPLSYQVIVYTPLRAWHSRSGTRLIPKIGVLSCIRCFTMVETSIPGAAVR
jgi:hypothetical protein